jgi:methylthioribose-1-phosphate isomerase
VRSAAPRDGRALFDRLRSEATAILEEDRAMCRRIGEHGRTLVPDGARVLTHCNAGALATAGIGTALAPIYLAALEGRRVEVFAGETRPLLQGSRLTAWELARAGIAVTVLTDDAAASLMRAGTIDVCIVGADRIAANGDVANKIGTYALAIAARYHDVPFYVAAPTSTFDPNTSSGAEITVEERAADEIRCGFGRPTVPAEALVRNPAFDVTPASLVTAFISDRGVLYPPYDFAETRGETSEVRAIGQAADLSPPTSHRG